MKRLFSIMITLFMLILALCGCASSADKASEATTSTISQDTEMILQDGEYFATFSTDSSMFHVNEAHHDKGILTVKDGVMTMHISLVSKNITNLFPGKAEDAQKDDAAIIEPVTDSITYNDGYTEDVYGFDISVPALNKEFNLALFGKKGKWYDHKVQVKNPIPMEGTYMIDVQLDGGSGRATVESPTKVTVKDYEAYATIIWSSPNYDYMIVDGEKYLPVNKEGNATFEIPLLALNTPIEVVGDTTAMSSPHEIDYTLTFDSLSMKKE